MRRAISTSGRAPASPAPTKGGGSEGGRSPPPRKSNATRTGTKRRRYERSRSSAGFAGAIEGGRVRKGGAAPLRGNQRRAGAAGRRRRAVAEGGRSRPHLGRHLYRARR